MYRYVTKGGDIIHRHAMFNEMKVKNKVHTNTLTIIIIWFSLNDTTCLSTRDEDSSTTKVTCNNVKHS